jgi:DNA-binding PadR family transcriptional regulator
MAIGRTERDLPGLTVLALLLTGPRHTYEMHRMMIDTHKDFVTGLPRSMYHSVERLLRDGLVVVADTVRDGIRPERIVYAITDAGRAEVVRRVRLLLETPDPDTSLLVAGLSFVGCLSPADAGAALRVRHDLVAARCAAIADGLEEARGERVPRVLLIEGEYELSRVRGERDWLAALLADLAAKRLDWPTDWARFLAEVPMP